MAIYDGGWTLADKTTWYPCYVAPLKPARHDHDHDHGDHRVVAGNPFAAEDELTVEVGGSVSGAIEESGETDTITVELVAGMTYTIYLYGSGDDPLTDTYLQILDPAGELVNDDDDGGIGTFSTITFTATEDGTYTLLAESFANEGDPGLGDYTVTVRELGEDTVPDDDTSTVALNEGTTFGALEVDGDIDVYALTVEAGLIYNIQLAGGADYNTDFLEVPFGELDTVLSVYDAEGTLVARNDDLSFPGNISSGLSFLAENAGTYYVVAEAYEGQTGGYSIDVDTIDPALVDPLDSIDWGTELSENHVTVYFTQAGEEIGEDTSLGWTDYEIDRAMAGFATYSQFADLTFEIVTDPSQATFTMITVESEEYLGRFGPPDTGDTAGYGWFAVNGTGWNDTGGLEQGGYGFITMIHEFGHGFGLAHPHDNGGGSEVMLGVTGPFNSYGLYNLNQGVYTTMSYNDGYATHPDAEDGFPPEASVQWGWQGTPSAFDIALIQQKYGAVEHATGDDVYVLPTENSAGTFWSTIWDTGGSDTIVHYGSAGALIDLTAATLDYSPTGGGVVSFVDGVFGGFTIANGVVIENATGGRGDDVLIGNAAANVLTGGQGYDTLMGREGDDTLLGGRLADTLDGGEGIDTASYADASSRISLNLALARAQDTLGGGFDTLVSIENVIGSSFGDMIGGNADANSIWGGDGHDTLQGRAGDDVLDGGLGNDMLSGGTGADTMTGGAGNDTYVVDSADDLVVELAGGGTDLVRSNVDVVLASEVENLQLIRGGNSGTGNELANFMSGSGGGDRLSGLAGNDILRGFGGDDRLDGGDGNDLIIGATGRDTLTGGAGRDTFRFAAGDTAETMAGADVITDFSQGDRDRINLSAIDANGAAEGDSFTFVGDAAFSGTAGELRFEAVNGRTYVQGDTNGDGVADLMIRLNTVVTLTAGDFVL